MNENAVTNESETNSRRLSEDVLQNEEEEEISITAEEIERLMIYDMMRQNFKLDDKIGASSSTAEEVSAKLNNNDSDSNESPRKHHSEINFMKQASTALTENSGRQTSLLNFFGRV